MVSLIILLASIFLLCATIGYICWKEDQKDFIENISNTLDNTNLSLKYAVGTIKITFFSKEYNLSVIEFEDNYYACDKPTDLMKYLKNESSGYNGILKVLDKNDIENIEYKDHKTLTMVRKKLTTIEKIQLNSIFEEEGSITSDIKHRVIRG